MIEPRPDAWKDEAHPYINASLEVLSRNASDKGWPVREHDAFLCVQVLVGAVMDIRRRNPDQLGLWMSLLNRELNDMLESGDLDVQMKIEGHPLIGWHKRESAK